MSSLLPSDRPLRPDEVSLYLEKTRPAIIYAIVNRLVAENMQKSTGVSIVKLSEVKKNIKESLGSSAASLDDHPEWLDFEPEYRDAGWIVHFDAGMSGQPPAFHFSPKGSTTPR